ncbi:hypothetical protein ABW20_dc0110568 [Dactylellina cionopaga]|nr:hypothetical protein ABW20_dc0110568 [Dactylellina cionopaga]
MHSIPISIAPASSGRRERPLGFYERFRVILHDLGYYNNVSIIARYSHGADLLASWPRAIFRAFGHAVQEHPALGITVVRDENQTLFYQRLSSVNLEKMIRFETLPKGQQEQERRLMTLSAEENNRGFENTAGQPLWRAVVLRDGTSSGDKYNFHIAFFWHHVIGDGRSGLAVHQSILEALQYSFGMDVDDKIDPTCVPVSIKPLFISMEQALPYASAPPMGNPQSNGDLGRKWTGGNYKFQPPIVTQLARIRLPAQGVQNIIGACRKNNTTVTALLQAVVGKALLDNIDLDRIRTAVAVSLRRFFSPVIDDSVMGLWISTYTTEYHKSQFDQRPGAPSALWECSRRNTAKINETIEDGGKNVEIMSLMGVDDYESSLKAKAGQPRDNSFGLTNLGVFKASQVRDKQGVVIDDMVFSQSSHANGAAFTICIVSVQGCDMNIVFNWQEGIVTQEKMNAIVDAVRAGLVEAGSYDAGRV